jgi:hypothetical protein
MDVGIKAGDKTKTLKLHSKRVENFEKYTRNEWRTLKNTLETGGDLRKIHSKREEKIEWKKSLRPLAFELLGLVSPQFGQPGHIVRKNTFE